MRTFSGLQFLSQLPRAWFVLFNCVPLGDSMWWGIPHLISAWNSALWKPSTALLVMETQSFCMLKPFLLKLMFIYGNTSLLNRIRNFLIKKTKKGVLIFFFLNSSKFLVCWFFQDPWKQESFSFQISWTLLLKVYLLSFSVKSNRQKKHCPPVRHN